MKRFLYIMPAVLILMLYAMLTILAGGVSGFQPVAVLNLCLPVVGGLLLRRGKWWGSLFGAAMGSLILFNSTGAVGLVAGAVLIGYYALMGLVCIVSRKKK